MNVRLSKDQKATILNSEDVFKVMQQILLRENKIRRNQEHFWIIGLDNANKILFIELISLGGVNKVVVSPSEIFRMAIYKMATKMILVHNHPNGIVKPSEDDLKLTLSMVQAGAILKIKVIDHLIITEDEFVSIQGIGLMNEYEK